MFGLCLTWSLMFAALASNVKPADQGVDCSIRAGLKITGQVTFASRPESGKWVDIVYKAGEYWLRYEMSADKSGRFAFFVFADGAWSLEASLAKQVELNHAYDFRAGWDGFAVSLAIDGERGADARCRGACRPSLARCVTGSPGKVMVESFVVKCEQLARVVISDVRTRELLPRQGSGVSILGRLTNIGMPLERWTLEARVENGASISPTHLELQRIGEYEEVPFELKVDAGTNGMVFVDLTLKKGRRTAACFRKRLVVMPERDPEFLSRAWHPPASRGHAFYVDSRDGDDGADGMSPETSWRTLARANSLTLGPGDRLLLRRGCAFGEELSLLARGDPENWAEIGAYGEGARPVVCRTRHINDRCGRIMDPRCLVVRDLTFCNAGMGLALVCEAEESGRLLVERCLFHHLEGVYDRFNSHGIPEWRDEKGAPNPGGEQSCGVFIGGAHARDAIVRDCEFYQCSNGFRVFGRDVVLTRLFCHDNYAHNTSPHPYFCASRSYLTDSVFDASGWHAAAGTMGVMLSGNQGLVIRGCHFLNQPDSGSPDEGGIDFEANGENCLVEACTFRNNAGAAIEVLGLGAPQARNVHVRRCKFDRDNFAHKNGPCEIQVWGDGKTSRRIACSNGLIEDCGCVLLPGVSFYENESPTSNDWQMAGNRIFDFSDELDRAYPFPEPPQVSVCGEIWTDRPEVALQGGVQGKEVSLRWEQTEGPSPVEFVSPDRVSTKAVFPSVGDYRVAFKADNGVLWRTVRTAVHVLPRGMRTVKAWDFSRNLDMQGWRVEETGTAYRFLPGPTPARDSSSHPVRLVCGDYLVVAVENANEACLLTADERNVGVTFNAMHANVMRVKMQNGTTARRMRFWWQVVGSSPRWDIRNSVEFDLNPQDGKDSVYEVALPPAGGVKQLKLSFGDGTAPITGTCRIDYIWLGNNLALVTKGPENTERENK